MLCTCGGGLRGRLHKHTARTWIASADRGQASAVLGGGRTVEWASRREMAHCTGRQRKCYVLALTATGVWPNGWSPRNWSLAFNANVISPRPGTTVFNYEYIHTQKTWIITWHAPIKSRTNESQSWTGKQWFFHSTDYLREWKSQDFWLLGQLSVSLTRNCLPHL